MKLKYMNGKWEDGLSHTITSDSERDYVVFTCNGDLDSGNWEVSVPGITMKLTVWDQVDVGPTYINVLDHNHKSIYLLVGDEGSKKEIKNWYDSLIEDLDELYQYLSTTDEELDDYKRFYL